MGKLFDSPSTVILILLVILLFGAKRLPDAARSLGRSIRIFKSEMDNPATKKNDAPTSGDSDITN